MLIILLYLDIICLYKKINSKEIIIYFASRIVIRIDYVAKVVLPILPVRRAVGYLTGYHYSRSNHLRNDWAPLCYSSLTLGTLNCST